MTVSRLVWIVVGALVVVSVFVGGVAVGTWNAQRAAFAGYRAGPGMMRSLTPSGVFTQTVPYTSTIPFGNGQRYGTMPRTGRGFGMMPGYGLGRAPGYGRGYGMMPNNRGNGRAPNYGRGGGRMPNGRGIGPMPGFRGNTNPKDQATPGRGRSWRR
jgi:hypothetical protein